MATTVSEWNARKLLPMSKSSLTTVPDEYNLLPQPHAHGEELNKKVRTLCVELATCTVPPPTKKERLTNEAASGVLVFPSASSKPLRRSRRLGADQQPLASCELAVS
jgi:hypothetical protein